MDPFCKDCGSNSFVDDYSDGSVVCTQCGLVAVPFLLDHRPLFDACRNVNSTLYVARDSYDSTHQAIEQALCRLNIDSDSLVSQAHDFAMEFKESQQYKGSVNALLAYATYEICKRNRFIISKNDICASFLVDTKTFDTFLSKKAVESDVVNVTINERIARLACACIDDRLQRMNAIQLASEIDAKLKKNKDYLSKKPSKMDSAILYHVCTSVFGMKLIKSTFAKNAGVSTVTFSKHLKFIQSMLA